MFRQIIVPSSNNLLLKIPDEFIGQQLEVIAFLVESAVNTGDEYSWDKALAFFAKHKISLSKYKFNRDEANER
jgi:hypothetical protein